MKILWLTNVLTPNVIAQVSMQNSVYGGWISGTYFELSKIEDVEIYSCCPFNRNLSGEGYSTFVIGEDQKNRFKDILEEYSPDIIHIWGTEFKHSFDMVMAAKEVGFIDRVVISIQGLISECANCYFANLPDKVIRQYTLRDFIRQDNIKKQKEKFEMRGEFEIAALRNVKHVIGRTDWDQACVKMINPELDYHFCNESLRSTFYENLGRWNIEDCEKHSIFVSQSSYPIKGFHNMIEAMSNIVKKYPNAKLYTTGDSPLDVTIRQKISQSSYKRYIGFLLKKYNLEKNVVFLGTLNEESMCNQYLKSNVFVCCSSIENSSNSVGEAMLLGVPIISSDVGGIRTLIKNNLEGFLYPFDEPYMISYYVDKVFEDIDLAKVLSKNASHHAEQIYDRKKNVKELIDIYRNIRK